MINSTTRRAGKGRPWFISLNSSQICKGSGPSPMQGRTNLQILPQRCGQGSSLWRLDIRVYVAFIAIVSLVFIYVRHGLSACGAKPCLAIRFRF